MPENKITIVFAQHWFIGMSEHSLDYEVRYEEPKIRKVFYKLDDAMEYINSVPNQYLPDHPYEPSIESRDSGFYLYQMQYDIR